MKPSALALLLAALLLVAVAPAASGARHRRAVASACAAGGSTTVAQSVQARVYVRSRRGDADEHLLLGCLFASGRTVQLASWFSCGCSRGDDVDPQVWLRGTVAAVNRWSCPPDPLVGGICSGTVRTVELRTRRGLRSADSGGYVPALVLAARGAFAFVGAGGAVTKADAAGRAVLDPGPGVEADSLALGGARVYWTRDGAPRSALLTP